MSRRDAGKLSVRVVNGPVKTRYVRHLSAETMCKCLTSHHEHSMAVCSFACAQRVFICPSCYSEAPNEPKTKHEFRVDWILPKIDERNQSRRRR